MNLIFFHVNFICSADTRPGLVPEKLAKKYQRDNQHQMLNALHRQQNKPRRILEAEERDKGLQKTLPPENRGFKLMEKMGYKPGTAIGKTGETGFTYWPDRCTTDSRTIGNNRVINTNGATVPKKHCFVHFSEQTAPLSIDVITLVKLNWQ